MNAPLLRTPVRVRAARLDEPIDRSPIDSFVREQAGSTPFHLPAWSIAVAKGCRQTSHYLVAERNNAIIGILPLIEVHSPLFGRALVSSGFAVDGGLLGTPTAVPPLVDAAWSLAARLSCPTVEFRGGLHPGDGWHVDTHSYCGFVRPLAANDEAELLAIPRKQRAEVRRSQTFALTVEAGRDPALAAEHYAVYAESVRNLGTPVFPAALFARVLEAFGDAAAILTVRHRGVAVASVLSVYWNGTVYPYWGGGTGEARTLRANDAMYFALMRHARERGCTHFDFGRSKTGTGAAAFKKNWGFEPRPLTYYKRAADGQSPREINPLSPKYRLQVAAWKRLPLGLANRIGPWISRGLG